MRPRVIPVLLVKDGGLVKPLRFKGGVYVGDPINAIRLFNELEADELIVLDISASRQKRGPDFDFLQDVTDECFMPVSYGGGITTVDEMSRTLTLGIEKVVVNQAILKDTSLLSKASAAFGSQSVVAAVDIKRNIFGKPAIYNYLSQKRLKVSPANFVAKLEEHGAGELFLNDVDREGMMKGYDMEMIQTVTSKTSVPVICCGGAGNVNDLKEVLEYEGAAAAAGSLFVFKSKSRGILINYLTHEQFETLKH